MRRWWWVVGLLAVTVAAGALWGAGLNDWIVVRARIPMVVLGGGVAVIVVIAAIRWHRMRLQRARVAAAALERETARQEHRRFVARLDHELKNPLAAISLGLTDLEQRELSEAGSGSAAGDRSVSTVHAQVARMTRLVGDLRRLNALDGAALEPEPVDLGEVVAEAAESVTDLPEFSVRRVEVHRRDRPWPLGPVSLDRDLISLAVFNVIANAAKYSPADAAIDVVVQGGQGAVTIEVSDVGLGIPASELAGVWDELVRGSNARHLGGSGLGLPMVRAVVDLHGGAVQIDSEERVGTRVVITLPRRGRAPVTPGADVGDLRRP